MQNHYPLIRHWKDVYDMVREVDSPWLKVCLDLPMMTRFDADFVLQAALTVGNLQVHSHFGGEFTRDASGECTSAFDFEKPLPDYAQFLTSCGRSATTVRDCPISGIIRHCDSGIRARYGRAATGGTSTESWPA